MRKMKALTGLLLLLLAFLNIRIFVNAEAMASGHRHEGIRAGTYFVDAGVAAGGQEVAGPIRIIVKSPYTVLNKEASEGIDASDFEYTKIQSISNMPGEELVEKANVYAWSLEDGSNVEIVDIAIEQIDRVEANITFSTAAGTAVKVNAYASSAEVYDKTDFMNIQGELYERDWDIEYRSVISMTLILLLAAPLALIITMIVVINKKGFELRNLIGGEMAERLKNRRKKRSRIIILLLLCSCGFQTQAAGSDQQYRFECRDVEMTVTKFNKLVSEGTLEAYIIKESGVKVIGSGGEALQVSLDLDSFGCEMMEQTLAKTAADRVGPLHVEPYKVRTLNAGDHWELIILGIALYVFLIAAPILIALSKRS